MRAKSILVPRVCQHCGKEFSLPLWRLKKPNHGLYCGKSCKAIVEAAERRKLIVRIDRTCLFCGNPFVIPQWKHQLGRGIYCDKSCKRKAENLARYGPVVLLPNPSRPGTMLVPLGSNKYLDKFAVIDELDAERVSARYWFVAFRDGIFYAASTMNAGNGSIVLMHRFILDPPQELNVDHRDGDGLNNTRANIRACTQSDNVKNSHTPSSNTSGYKGVSWSKVALAWVAHIGANGLKRNLGTYPSPEAAAHVYDEAARRLHGDFARLNFPREGERAARRG